MRSHRSLFLWFLLASGLTVPLSAQEPVLLHKFAGALKLESQGEVRLPEQGQVLLAGDVLSTRCGNATLRLKDVFTLHLLAESKLEVVDPLGARAFRAIEGKFRVESGSGEHVVTAPPSRVSFSPGRYEMSVTDLGEDGAEASLGVVLGTAQCQAVVEETPIQLTLQPGKMTVLSPWDEPLVEEFAEGQIAPPDETQVAYAVKIVRGADIENRLPPNATPGDSVILLASLGIFPCAGKWDPEAPVCLEDVKCVIGLPPDDPRLSIPFDEQISLLIQNNSEIFFLQTRRRLPVSPFAP